MPGSWEILAVTLSLLGTVPLNFDFRWFIAKLRCWNNSHLWCSSRVSKLGLWLLQHLSRQLYRELEISLPSWLTSSAGKLVLAAGWELSQGWGLEDSVALHMGLSMCPELPYSMVAGFPGWPSSKRKHVEAVLCFMTQYWNSHRITSAVHKNSWDSPIGSHRFKEKGQLFLLLTEGGG